jgi:16S rRNA (guanine1516-N2)-methyltransferase
MMTKICQIHSEPTNELSEAVAALNLPLCKNYQDALDLGHKLILCAEGAKLSLLSSTLGKQTYLEIDFAGGTLDHRRHYGGGRNQDLCRAVGLNRQRNLQIADATAGLGRDAFILSLQGAQVSAYEKNPVLACMLTRARQQGLEQASVRSDTELLEVLNRLNFIYADSSSQIKPQSFDVVYMDPMFPQREKSAKVKKEMQILHQLLEDDKTNSQHIFATCSSAARSRLVIKRPAKAPLFADEKPSHQIMGKAIRYDVYVKGALPI